MSVRENLIAARALIETGRSADEALDQVTGARTIARKDAYQAVRDAKPADWTASDWGRKDRVLARFDRAIAAQPEGEAP